MARIVCQVLHRSDRITFIWSQDSATFAPYHLNGERAGAFLQLGRQARTLLTELSVPGNAVAPALAQVGWHLYQAIFPHEPLPLEIQGWLADLRSKNAIDSLEIASDMPGTVPWNAVYELSPDDGALAAGQPQALQPFWGIRYPLTIGRRVNGWRHVPRLEAPAVLLVADSALLQALPTEQRGRLADLARDKELQLIESRSMLEAAFQDGAPDFVYIFCRAHAHGFSLGQDAVSLSELRDFVQGGAAEPLVFLNLARGERADSTGSHFARLLTTGLDGLIATEEPGPAEHGHALGLEFLADVIYDGKPVGAALQTLRSRAGVSGLLVAASCPAHLRVTWEDETDANDASISVPAGPLPDYPYRPLAPYDREDRALFAGRDQDVADFAGWLDRAETRLLILHGVSGVGKASFLHAGVVPYLEDEAVGFQALRDRTPGETAAAETDYPVIAIRATHDLAGQLAEALCAYCAQPYAFTSPTGQTTTVDLPGILRRLIGAQDRGSSASTAMREFGAQDQIQPAGGGLSGPPPLPSAADDEEVTPTMLWEALQNDPGLFARLLAGVSELLPYELVILIEQGEDIFTQATRPVDRRRRRQVLEMLRRVDAGQCKLIYALRTEFLGRFLDELPGQESPPSAFLLPELEDDRVVEAILLPTVTDPLPYADEIPNQKYRFAYADGIPQIIVKNARQAGGGNESMLPRVQAICAQLYDLLGDRQERVIGEPDLKVLVKGELAYHLAAYVEKKLTFLPQRSDRRKFIDLLQHLYRRESDGTVVRNLVTITNLAEQWRGSIPLDVLVNSASADNVRIFELNQLLIGGKEGLYVSLSQDALAQAALTLADNQRRLSYGRSKMVDMLWVFIPLLFLVAVLVYVYMRPGGAGGGQDSFTKGEVEKIINNAHKQFQEQAEAVLGYPVYTGRMSLAQQALQTEDTLRARQLLLTQQGGGKADQRGFEWFYLWRRAMQEERSLLGHKGLITSVAVSANGKLLASASVDGTVKLWDSGGTIRTTFEGQGGAVNAVAFSSDGKTLASAGADKTVRVWDVNPGKDYAVIKKSRATLSGHEDAVLTLAFALDNSTLASGGADRAIIFWNTGKGEKERDFKGHGGAVRSLAFAPDGKTLASGGDDGVNLWERASGKQQSLKGPGGAVFAVAFSPDGERIAAGGAERKDNIDIGTIRVWDAKSGKIIGDNIQYSEAVFTLAYGPGGKTLFSGGKDNLIRVWDAVGQAMGTMRGHLGWVGTLALSANGGTLVSGSYDQSVKVWSPATALQPDVLHGHKDWVCSVAFSPDDRILASAGRDGTIRLWDVERGTSLQTITGLSGSVLAVAFSPAKRVPKLAAGTWDEQGNGEIKIFELSGGKEVKELHTFKRPKGGIACLAFSHDGKILASGGADQAAVLWDVASGKEKHVLKGHQAALRAVAFSVEDQLLATGGDDKVIRLWDVNSGKEKRSPLQGHTAPITALAYFPKDLLLSTGYDQTIRIWSESKSVAMLRGHAGPILSLALDPKTGSIFSGGWDHTVKVWELRPGGDERFTFTGHRGPVRGVALSHDGRTLASASHDGTVRLWRTAENTVLGPEH